MIFADNWNISTEILIIKFLEEAQSRKSKEGKTANEISHIKLIVKVLFGAEDKKGREKCCKELVFAAKREHWGLIFSIIRQHLYKVGFVRTNIVTSLPVLSIKNQSLMQSFIEIFRPKRTYSGSGTSLITAVKYFAYINFGRVDFSEPQVDIWGDGNEIEKKNSRLVLKILNQPAINSLSIKSVIPFAFFTGEYLFLFHEYLRRSETKVIE